MRLQKLILDKMRSNKRRAGLAVVCKFVSVSIKIVIAMFQIFTLVDIENSISEMNCETAYY